MNGVYVLVFQLLFAPLFFAGNRPIPLLVMELLALVLIVFLLKNVNAQLQIPKKYWIFVLCIFLLPLMQLIPVPYGLWTVLPGHASYASALSELNAVPAKMRALSIVPSATEYAWLAILPALSVFLYTLTVNKEQLRFLTIVFVGMALFQAVLGLMQYGAGPESLLRPFDSPHKLHAVGTYMNRDHLAGLLEMALPLGLALLTASIGHSHVSRRHVRTLRQKLALLTATHVNKAFVYAFVCILLLLGLIFTHSRTGNALAMLIILLSTLAFATRLGGRNVYGVLGTLTMVASALAIEIGMVPVLNRFIQEDALQDGRWIIFNGTLSAIGEFFPFGSGFGTFGEVYPRFHEQGFGGVFVNNAHNDYLEWVMEGGLPAALLIVVFFVFYFSRWPKVWQRGQWKMLNFIQVGAGIGMFAMLLHTFVDFNLHIPANQIYFAFLAALFFYQLPAESDAAKAGVEPELEKLAVTPAVAASQEKKSFLVQSANPFSE